MIIPDSTTFDQRTVLQSLLAATVGDLREESPGLGEVVAFDVTHIYAYVRENNRRAYVKNRYDKDHQPRGDRDCKLGVKKSTNKEQADGSKIDSIRNLNTLTYLLIKARALRRARELNANLLTTPVKMIA